MKRNPKRSRAPLRVFEIVQTFETEEIAVEDPDLPRFVFRVELLKDSRPGGRFQARLYRKETFRLQPTFPQEAGQPKYDPSDEVILVGDSFRSWEEFQGRTAKEVLARVLSEIRKIFNRSVTMKRTSGGRQGPG